MSNRRKLRVPGRYERPAKARPPLGAAGAQAEAGVRAGYLAGARAIGAVQQHRQALQVATVESDTGTVEHVDVAEATAGGVRAVKGRPAELMIDIIRSGWNKSGSRFYPAEVLERDIPVVYPAGTQMFIDHPRLSEQEDIPERSLRGLAAVFTGTPYAVREGDQTVMKVQARVFSQWREFLTEAHDVIGVSINGSGDGSITEREGRSGLVLERLTHGQSVDFVTKPGAGGRIVALLESARVAATREAASLGAWLESRMHLGFTQIADELYGDGRLTRDERIAASSAVGDALGAFVAGIEGKAPQLYQRDRWATPETVSGEVTREASVDVRRNELHRAVDAAHSSKDRFTYVRDFDPEAGIVWYSTSEPNGPGRLWQQGYRVVAGGVELVDGRTEVREKTVYEPVSAITESDPGRPAGTPELAEPVATPTTTQTPDGGTPAGSTADEAITAKEKTMTDTKVTDAAAREADEAVRTREALELAQYRQFGRANDILNSKLAESNLPALAQNRVRAGFPATSLPLQESDRALNVAAFTTTVEAAIKAESDYVAQILEANGAGRVTGNGAAAGAGAGAPAGYAQTRESAPAGGGLLFGAPLGLAGVMGAGAGVGGGYGLSEADRQADTALRESLIKTYTDRGMTREAAEQAVDAH